MRTITPHKGGRSTDLHIRITPDVKARLTEQAQAMGVSVADLVERLVESQQYLNLERLTDGHSRDGNRSI